MDKNVREWKKIITLKDELITVKSDLLLKKYHDKDYLLEFLDSVNLLCEKESPFLHTCTSFIEIIEMIMNDKRDEQTQKETRKARNQVLTKLNIEKSYSPEEQELIIKNYVISQNAMRRLIFDDMKQFLGAMSYDKEILERLMNGTIHEFPYHDLFLSATNYFLEIIPEIYQEEPIYQQTIDQFNKIKNLPYLKNRYLKKYMKTTKVILDFKQAEKNN